jgi:hypothetical protein
MTHRMVKMDVDAAIKLGPGTIERLKVNGLTPLEPDEFEQPDPAIEEE